MIRISHIVAEGLESPVDLILPAGLAAALVTAHERENEVIIRLLIGFQLPLEGQITVNDSSPLTLRDADLASFRRKIGIIYADGGMLSNLNVWDNLTLQLVYEGGHGSTEVEAMTIKALEDVGYSGPLGVLPFRLTQFQRRQIAFARTLLARPDLVIYQSFLDGLNQVEHEHLRLLAAEYHDSGTERTALFLSSHPDSLKGIELDFLYNRRGASQS